LNVSFLVLQDKYFLSFKNILLFSIMLLCPFKYTAISIWTALCARNSRIIVLSDSHRMVIRNRCWPFCFIPLMMKRAKRVRMICPLCGHVYRNFKYKNAKLTPSKPTDVENSKAAGLASRPIPANFRVRATREESLEN